jgi:hypothetical protein
LWKVQRGTGDDGSFNAKPMFDVSSLLLCSYSFMIAQGLRILTAQGLNVNVFCYSYPLFAYREVIQSRHEYKNKLREENLTPSKAYDR